MNDRKQQQLRNSRKNKYLKSNEITLFTRQLTTMVTAGIPLAQSFDIIVKSRPDSALAVLAQKIKYDLERGLSLSSALKKHPKNFDELYCGLISIGEHSGTLDIILARIASYQERIGLLKRKVKKALVYPAAVILVAILVMALMLLKVVPTFQELYQGLGKELPFFTQCVIQLSELLREHFFLLLMIFLGCFYIAYKYYQKNTKFQHFIQKITFKAPLLSNILEKAYIARFAKTLAITTNAGLSIIDALRMIADATTYFLFKEMLHKIRKAVTEGNSLSHILESSKEFSIFPPLVKQLITIGEETGKLDEMLEKISYIYEEEINTLIDGLTTLLEPIIMIILGVLVGGLSIAMYLPIFQMGELY